MRGIIKTVCFGLIMLGMTLPGIALADDQQAVKMSDVRPIYRQGMVGVGLFFNYTDDKRSIVDLGITVKPYDSYGLLVIGKFRENVPALIKLDGTVSAMGEPVWLEWERIWKDPNVTCVEVQSVKVVYDDGTQEFFFRNIRDVLGADMPSCRK